MSRHVRLALLLAALAAAGPTAAPLAFLASRELVGIAWLRVTTASPLKQRSLPATPVAVAERAEFSAEPDRVLPDSFRVHSLFQRPPPLRS